LTKVEAIALVFPQFSESDIQPDAGISDILIAISWKLAFDREAACRVGHKSPARSIAASNYAWDAPRTGWCRPERWWRVTQRNSLVRDAGCERRLKRTTAKTPFAKSQNASMSHKIWSPLNTTTDND
jgi:hypothetical protein